MVIWPQWYESRKVNSLTSSNTSQTQIQAFELAYHNIYPIEVLLYCMKGLVLQIQNYWISNTRGNNRTSERSTNEASSNDKVAEVRGLEFH